MIEDYTILSVMGFYVGQILLQKVLEVYFHLVFNTDVGISNSW
jgi:hypothetical protein